MNYSCGKVQNLIDHIEAKLQAPSQDIPDLIGVFGMNSDIAICDAIRQLRPADNYLGHVHNVPGADIYTLIAGKFLSEYKRSGSPYATTDEKRELIYELNMLTVGDSSREKIQENPLGYYTEKQRDAEHARLAIRNYKRVKKIPENVKLVLWIEFGIGEINYNVIRKLQNIQSPDLLIIISTIQSRELLISRFSSEYNTNGILVLNKLFPYTFVFEDCPKDEELSENTIIGSNISNSNPNDKSTDMSDTEEFMPRRIRRAKRDL